MEKMVKTLGPDIHALLFDLDGTLLQVEMRRFIPAYLEALAACFVDTVPPERFTRVAQQAVHHLLMTGDAQRTNRERYLGVIEAQLAISVETFEERLHAWLDDGLEHLAGLVSPIGAARPLLDHCFTLGIPVVLATNPVFPAAMIEARLAWGGLDDYPFDTITSYENTRFCKPQAGYFRDLLDSLGVDARHCLMVGNDTEHDLAAGSLGIPTFLADTFLIDRLDGDYRSDHRGSLGDLLQLLKAYPDPVESKHVS